MKVKTVAILGARYVSSGFERVDGILRVLTNEVLLREFGGRERQSVRRPRISNNGDSIGLSHLVS